MQGPRASETAFRDPLRFAEYMVNTYTDGAKFYWKMWGPFGEPIIQAIDAWAEMQRGYLDWLREAYQTDPSQK